MKRLIKRLTAAVVTTAMVFSCFAVTSSAYGYEDYLRDAATMTDTLSEYERLLEISEVVSLNFVDNWGNEDIYKNLHFGIGKLADENDEFFADYMAVLIELQSEKLGTKKRVLPFSQTNAEILINQIQYTKNRFNEAGIDPDGKALGDTAVTDNDIEKYALNALIAQDPDVYFTIVDSMMSFTDIYSHYVLASEYYVGQDDSSVGIGATVQALGSSMLVLTVTPGGGADKAGIVKGDAILAVDGKSFDTNDIHNKPKTTGVAGTTVDITVMKLDGTVETIPVERITASAGTVTSRIFDDTYVIHFESFEEMDDAKQFEIFYDEAVKNPKIKKLVIDLRENGGGDSDVLGAMLSVLTEKGMELYSIDQKDPALRQTHISEGKYLGAGKKFAGQLFVITNGNTASSADIMTGVIKNIGGIQVGEPTYGKGIGQSGYIVHNGYMLWVTALLVDLPNYGYYHGIPFEPDVPVSAMEQAFTADEFLPLEDTVTPITPDSDPERIKAYQQRILLYGPDMLIPSGVLDKRTFWFTNAILATSGTEPLAGDMDNYHVDTETLKFLAGGIDEKNFMNILTKTETDEALQYCLDYNVSKKAA